MCTLTNQTKFLTAKKPRTCYKALMHCSSRSYTPVQMVPIKCSCLSGNEDFVAIGTPSLMPTSIVGNTDVGWMKHYKNFIERGFIHCFIKKEDACKFGREAQGHYSTAEIWEVEVPEGAQYITGVNGYDYDENNPFNMLPTIAAERIKFIKRVI